jgi:drug/metabolite transporter (DMT)-like permease
VSIYYRGLRETPASAATIAELAFPLTAIGINWIAFDAVLTATQWLGVAVLSATIVLMTRLSARGADRVGVILSPPRWEAETRPATTP